MKIATYAGGTLVLLLAASAPAGAQRDARCTREVLNVRGIPVTASLCVQEPARVPAGRELPVRVTETYSSPRGSFGEDRVLRFLAGEPASRIIEDVPLDRLGMAGVLHLTLLWEGGALRVDSAILTPGATTIK